MKKRRWHKAINVALVLALVAMLVVSLLPQLAYADNGTGSWTITKTFTATGTHTDVQLTGLQWAVSGDGNLMAANDFTAVTLANGDTLTVTWTLTLS